MRGIIAPLPDLVSVAITDVCPFRCVMCHHAHQHESQWRHASFPPHAVVPLLRQAMRCALHGVGEPQASPHFWSYVPDPVPPSCDLGWNTLGHLLAAEDCERIVARNVGWINFSICAGTAATYRKIHGASWAHLWRGVDRLLDRRGHWPRPALKASMIVMRDNVAEIGDLMEMCRSRDFECLLVYHLNQPSLDVPDVPWHDGSGQFRYSEQAEIPAEDDHLRAAACQARRLDFRVLAVGYFLGRHWDHGDLREAVARIDDHGEWQLF